MKSITSTLTVNNLFSGFIVAVVALPLCIAFAIASGANPMAGIISGVVGGLIAALVGSSRYQVSGPAAAFITILYGIIAQHGFPVLLAATLVAGLVVLAIAMLKLGKLMDLMPHSVIVGFTTGIGVLILLGQIPAAFGISAPGKDVLEKIAFTAQHWQDAHLMEFLVIALTISVALVWARTRLARWIPAPLVALGAGTALSAVLANSGNPVRTIGALYDISLAGLGVSADFLATIPQHGQTIVMAGFTIGILIAVETLLSAKALDAMTNTRHNPDRELVGLGLANLAIPFLGGIPASGVIVRGSTNVMSGASSKSSAAFHAIFLAAFVALLYAFIQQLPMASLAGILLLTARRLIEVHELATIARIDRWEGAMALLTVVLTVVLDLTVSVPIGVALMLAMAMRRMLSETSIDVRDQHGQVVLVVNDGMNFLNSPGLLRELERHLKDDRVSVINLAAVRVMDSTAALMVASVARQHPTLGIWVASQRIVDKLAHAGVDAARIALMGNRVVNLPQVFQRLQPVSA
jgi:sulfate permease, SulP family